MKHMLGRFTLRRSERVQVSYLKSPISAAALLSLILPITAPAATPYRLMTLDPGHFHAALVQKDMYPEVDPTVFVFAPAGLDLDEHMKRIDRFNTRTNNPTRWETRHYTGPDFADQLFKAPPGNLLVLSGNNAKKTDYILRAVQNGLHVLADKPMAITPEDFGKLQRAFTVAEKQNVLLYDIMTERFEITTALQRELSRDRGLFGDLIKGHAGDPAITKESVHHFAKLVAGAPLKRPAWFFDTRQQGEGIVDVTTHLVDLVQWEAYPEVTLDPSDAVVVAAKRWATAITPAQFAQVTGLTEFPDYLKADVGPDGALQVYANGSFDYTLRGTYARVSVTWNFEAPMGAKDTHYSMMRGTQANLIIKQGAEQQYKPTLYVESVGPNPPAMFESRLRAALEKVKVQYPGLDLRQEAGAWVVTVPPELEVGHEAHFAQVTANYLRYLKAGKLPEWEVPNMITKYATIMQAYRMSRPAAVKPTAATP